MHTISAKMNSKDLQSQTICYGIRSIKQLRSSQKSLKNPAKALIVKDIEEYFSRNLDHLISRCITYLLCLESNPERILHDMLDYFKKTKNNRLDGEVVPNKLRRPRSDEKLILITRIGPVILKLVNRMIFLKPEEPIDYLINELETMLALDDEQYVTQDSENNRNNNAEEIYKSSNELENCEGQNARASRPHTAPGSRNDKVDLSARPVSALLPTNVSKSTLLENMSQISLSNTSIQNLEHPSAEVLARKLNVLIIGLGNSGKTTMLNALQGELNGTVKPTVGFRPVSLSLDEKTTVNFYDLGGSPKIRDIWPHYFHDVHAVIYLIDSSNHLSVEENHSTFNAIASHALIRDKPILVMANKQDIPNCRRKYDILRELNIQEIEGFIHIEECSGIGINLNGEFECDPHIESGIEWLLQAVKTRYAELNDRVKIDSHLKAQEEARKQLARERNVLKSKIASAFYHDIDPTKMPGNVFQSPQDIFDEMTGLQFLASEIGEDDHSLEDIGKLTAAGVGYQRLALQIIGGLKCPISKKKSPMSWKEIYDLVLEIRSELGLEN